MSEDSGIHIKKKNRGKLTDLAKKEGAVKDGKIKRSWLETKANSKNKTIAKRAQFALNARGWDN